MYLYMSKGLDKVKITLAKFFEGLRVFVLDEDKQKMMKTIMIIVIIKITMKSKRNENNYRSNWPALSKSLIWLRTLIKWTS